MSQRRKIPDKFFHQCFLITLCVHPTRAGPHGYNFPGWLSRCDVVVHFSLTVDGRPHNRLIVHNSYVTFMSASILCHGCFLIHICNLIIGGRPHFLLKATFACTFCPSCKCNVSLFSSSETLVVAAVALHRIW